MEKKKRIRWGKEIGNFSEEELVEWIIKFCDENGITSPKQLNIEFPGVCWYYAKLSKENKEKIFPPKHKDWKSKLGNLSEEKLTDWIKNFCNKNDITSSTQLSIEFPGVYKYYKKLSKEGKKKIFPPKHKDWYSKLAKFSEEELVEWIIKFCNENGITSPRQLCVEFSGVYNGYYAKLSKESKEKIFPPKQKDWYSELGKLSEGELVEWIIKFCDENGITSSKQLNIEFPGVYVGYYAKLSKENKEKIFLPKYKNWKSELGGFSEEELVNWIKNLCNKNGITSPRQLNIEFPGVYDGYYVKLSKENKEKIFPPKYKYWDEVRELETEEEQADWIKNFCNKNDITSSTQLSHCYGGLWLIYRGLSKENREKIFTPVISLGEETLGRLLTDGGYVFTTQKDFPDLRSNKGGILRYDVYIKQKNCLIEFHGKQHFDPNVDWYEEEGIERDRIKYQYAIDHDIPLFYITDCIEEYKKYGYFTEVLTDWDKLIESINSLPDVIVDAEDTAQN